MSLSAHRKHRGRSLICAAAGTVALGWLPAMATTTYQWIGGTSNWNNGANWATNPPFPFPGSLPGFESTVNVTSTNGASFAVTYDFPSITLGTLTLNTSGATATILQSSDVLASAIEIIGTTGNGNVVQSGGTNQVVVNIGLGYGGSLVLASAATGTGSYTLSGTGTLSVDEEIIGDGGFGTFDQTGATNLAYQLYVGTNVGSTGDYVLTNNGTLQVENGEVLGNLGSTGIFFQSGGANVGNIGVDIGSEGTGSYTLAGGTLSQYNVTISGGKAGSVGTLTQTGGLNSSYALNIGAYGKGTYNLSGGILAPTFLLRIGAGGFTQSPFEVGGLPPGTNALVQTGGICTANDLNEVIIGDNQNGSYLLSNSGTFSVTNTSEYIGVGGTGSFVQSGGLHTIHSGSIILGTPYAPLDLNQYSFPGSGSYTLSNTGTLMITGGNETIGDYGMGTFTQSGGLNSLTTGAQLQLGGGPFSIYGGVAVDTYALSGSGTLSVATGAEFVSYYGSGDLATFTQSGGLNTLDANSSLYIGNGNNVNLLVGSGSYLLNGGILDAAGNVYVGDPTGTATGVGVLTVSGMGQLNCAGTLTLNNRTANSIQINGGTVTAQTANLNATLTQTAGTVAFGQITGAGDVSISGGQMSLNTGGGPSAMASLIVTGSGTLDVGNNTLAINYGSPANDPVGAIAADLASGYDGGTWTGTGITSSAAAAGAPLLSVGYADGGLYGGTAAGPNQILIMLTKAGDANLDGTVDISDLDTLALNYGLTSGATWAQGDFDYGGGVDFNDLELLLANYSLPAPGTVVPIDVPLLLDERAVSLLQSDGFVLDALPEPASMSVFLIPALLALRHRRRPPRPHLKMPRDSSG